MAFSTSLDRILTNNMAQYTAGVIAETIGRLAAKFGFDKDEAENFLLGGGITVKLPALERSKLPWCSMVDGSCCRAIKKNGGLFTQCEVIPVEGSQWCKKCTKDVEKNGTPSNGDVEARLAVDTMKYKIGKTEVKPYLEVMEKSGITREQAEEAAAEYGMTIDPRQFEKKKRGRKVSNPAAMTPIVEPSIELATEELATEPSVSASLPVASVSASLPVASAASESETETPSEEEDSEEEVEDDKPLTLKYIKEMKAPEVLMACAKYKIDVKGKSAIDLKKELKTKVT